MKTQELLKILRKNKCYVIRNGSRHDIWYSEITGKSSKTVKYVGPIKPNEDLIIFGIVDYVPACSKIVIGDITLEYSDGTSDTGWYGWSTTYRNSSIK